MDRLISNIVGGIVGGIIGTVLLTVAISYYYIWRRPYFIICPFLIRKKDHYDEARVFINVICSEYVPWKRVLRFPFKRKKVVDVWVTGYLQIKEPGTDYKYHIDIIFKDRGYIPILYSSLLLRVLLDDKEFCKELKNTGLIKKNKTRVTSDDIRRILNQCYVTMKIFATYSDEGSGSRLAREKKIKEVKDFDAEEVKTYEKKKWLKIISEYKRRRRKEEPGNV